MGLRALIRGELKDFHWTTVETRGNNEGVPDVHGCREGVSMWVECKGTATATISLRTAQTVWARQYERAGGRVFLAVRWRAARGVRRQARDELWLLDAARVGRLALPSRSPRTMSYTLSEYAEEERLLVTAGGPRRWDWDAVRAVLLGQVPPT